MRQNKIDAQVAEIATVKAEPNKALQENKKEMKDLLNPERNGRGHDQSSRSNDHEEAPKNITGHSV